MGRSVESVRQGVNAATGRWARSARRLEGKKRTCGEKLAALARNHSSEAFFVCDSPLEAAIFSGFVEVLRRRDEQSLKDRGPYVDH